MSDLVALEANLPNNVYDLRRYILFGRDKLTAVRAEIHAISKVGLGKAVYEEKLAEAQELAEAVLDAETRVGELISKLPTAQGKRTDLLTDSNVRKSKREVLEESGLTEKQGQRFEKLAQNPSIVERVKAEAREQGDIVTREKVLNEIKNSGKPYVTNNTGDYEWFTPECFIKSAKLVMGTIDLDPASCAAANNDIVHAKQYYTLENSGLEHEWYGNIWLNPPYNNPLPFIDKLCKSNINQAIVLVNNCTQTKWFKELVLNASAIVFTGTRTKFIKPGKELSPSMQGQAIVYIGKDPLRFLYEFLQYGWGTVLTTWIKGKKVKNNKRMDGKNYACNEVQ